MRATPTTADMTSFDGRSMGVVATGTPSITSSPGMHGQHPKLPLPNHEGGGADPGRTVTRGRTSSVPSPEGGGTPPPPAPINVQEFTGSLDGIGVGAAAARAAAAVSGAAMPVSRHRSVDAARSAIAGNDSSRRNAEGRRGEAGDYRNGGFSPRREGEKPGIRGAGMGAGSGFGTKRDVMLYGSSEPSGGGNGEYSQGRDGGLFSSFSSPGAGRRRGRGGDEGLGVGRRGADEAGVAGSPSQEGGGGAGGGGTRGPSYVSSFFLRRQRGSSRVPPDVEQCSYVKNVFHN